MLILVCQLHWAVKGGPLVLLYGVLESDLIWSFNVAGPGPFILIEVSPSVRFGCSPPIWLNFVVYLCVWLMVC